MQGGCEVSYKFIDIRLTHKQTIWGQNCLNFMVNLTDIFDISTDLCLILSIFVATDIYVLLQSLFKKKKTFLKQCLKKKCKIGPGCHSLWSL